MAFSAAFRKFSLETILLPTFGVALVKNRRSTPERHREQSRNLIILFFSRPLAYPIEIMRREALRNFEPTQKKARACRSLLMPMVGLYFFLF
jgi:hypothetical protein